MPDYMHIDFSKKTKTIELLDLLAGNWYSSKVNIFNTKHCEAYKSEVESKRTGLTIPESGIQHWIHRGWDAALPLYLSSRHMKFIDSGHDRISALGELYGSYTLAGECPALKHKTNFLEKPLYLKDFELGSEWLRDHKSGIAKRKTKRAFRDLSINSTKFVSIISHATRRITNTFASKQTIKTSEKYVRSYGCAFNLHALIYNVDGLSEGIYEINAEIGTIGKYKAGNFRQIISNVNWGMPAALSANYTIVLTINPILYSWRYRHDRALRNLMIEAGRIMHEFVVAASCFSVQGVVTPAIADSQLSDLLELDKCRQLPFYTGTFGAVSHEERE